MLRGRSLRRRSLPWVLACGLASSAAVAQTVSVEPTVLNRREIAVPLVEHLLGAGLIPDGTLFVSVRVTDDGRLAPVDAYGLLAAHPTVGRSLREATSTLKVWTPREWLAANPERRWAVFWMFQQGDCALRVYTAPERVLPVRVCLPVKNGRADVNGARVLFDVADRVAQSEPVRLNAGPGRPMPYPSRARKEYLEGAVVARATIGRDGRTTSVGIVSERPPDVFRPSVEDFLRRASWTGTPGAEGYSKLLAFEFLMSPCISVPDAVVAERITLCTSRPP